MKTITLPVCNRPDYLKRVVSTIRNNDLNEYKLFIGAEPVNEEVIEICKSIDFIETNLVINKTKLGVRKNPFKTLQRAFDSGSVFNIHLEDDVIISPDATLLANWYFSYFKNNPCYMHYGFFNYESDDKFENKVTEINSFNGYGWCIFKSNWESLYLKEWFNDTLCSRMFGAYGWDHAMAAAYHVKGYKGIIPKYSRSQNIGREGGVYCSASFYDKTFSNIKHNNNLLINKYEII